ncbi:hematopoietic cell signal transducer [Myripristis murdjan]|uniref:hematopoietic cell signal transducer n=1 Tax=Myripristis murdjan TaxID=586833 RepID=UPI001175DE7C|nr:hematopoietic cell signal transducer-like [Myripristis murdjan]
MADNKLFIVILLSLYVQDLVKGETDTTSCYRIEPGTMAGIIAADLVLTVIIVIVTYLCASSRRQRRENADKVYMNVRANCKI